jgi:gliding motility-associated-like protein
VEPLIISTTLIPSVYAGGYNITGCNNDGTIDLQVTGGSHPYIYSWYSLNGTGWVPASEDQAFLTEGTYIVTITDTNNCTAVDSIFMDAAGDLVQSYTTSTYLSGHNISCFGLSDGSIDLTVTGGVGPYTYQWSNFATTEDLDNIPAGTYTVTVTDQNNCTETLSVTLTEPTVLTSSITAYVYPSGDNISCNGFADGSIDITVENGSPGYTYTWITLDGSGLFTTEEDQSGLTAGTYSVTATDTNGCTITSTITLAEPLALSVNINILSDFYGMAVSCTGNSDGEIEAAVIGGSPNYVYSWNTVPVQTNPILSGLGEGSYIVTITDINGCIAADTAELIANPLPTLNPDPAIEVCEGEMVTFSSNSNSLEMCSWTLSNGMSLDLCGPNTVYIAEPGCYDANLVVTNEFGCSDSIFLSNYICINANPIADFSASTYDATIIENVVSFQNLSYGATDYEWEFGDGDYSNDEHVTHSFPSSIPGEYNVVLYAYDEMGCFDSISKIITVWDELLFYTPNTFTPDGNEHNNVFVPVFGSGYSAEDYSFKIFNRWGELVFESKDPAFGWDGTYNGVQMQVGTYSWKMILKVSDITLAPAKKGLYTGHVNLLR